MCVASFENGLGLRVRHIYTYLSAAETTRFFSCLTITSNLQPLSVSTTLSLYHLSLISVLDACNSLPFGFIAPYPRQTSFVFVPLLDVCTLPTVFKQIGVEVSSLVRFYRILLSPHLLCSFVCQSQPSSHRRSTLFCVFLPQSTHPQHILFYCFFCWNFAHYPSAKTGITPRLQHSSELGHPQNHIRIW